MTNNRPDRRRSQHGSDPVPALAQRLVAPARAAVVLDHDRDQQSDQGCADADREKGGAPADGGGGKGERRGGQQGAERSETDLQAGERGKAVGGNRRA
jgi:hypothetical protein